MKKIIYVLVSAAMVVGAASCGKQYNYESVKGDPLKARIYTLDNGLKVYMTVYKNEPRIQTYVAVRVGGKNDPVETTGLAHYLEHLMFKGTSHFGTWDYEREKPLLDSIERLFEVYRTKTDEAERKAIYAQIDAISQEAAKYAIANEYDKLMAAIGASNTNAFTSDDLTVYQENIPSNQVENWAKIQTERFANPVIRLFHTELETVYEEKNRAMNQDGDRIFEALMAGLFPTHPYGTQTVIGTQEHLKNPSITNIKNFFDWYYVPNNMAVCMSGDFDPDEAIKIIDKYFGTLKRGNDIQPLKIVEKPLTEPVEKTVYGKETPSIAMAYRFDSATSDDAIKLKLLDMVLTNGKAGLVDLNVNQQQRLLNAGTGVIDNADYQALYVYATPKQGQTLQEARDIMLEQIGKLQTGDFPDWLLPAVITDFKLNRTRSMESNRARAMACVGSFINNTDWAREVAEIDSMEKITKEDLITFANSKLADNYVIVYKQLGDPDIKPMDKPIITPLQMNRDTASAFVGEVRQNKVRPITPVFLDFKKDIAFLTAKSKIPVLYKENTENDLFELNYVFDMGSDNDRELALAIDYLQYLGTDKYSAEQLKEEFYKLGCNFSVSGGDERVYVSLNGLAENTEAALTLLEHLLANATVNKTAYDNLVADILKRRADDKLNHHANFARLQSYGRYGALSPATNILSEKELYSVDIQSLTNKIKGLCEYKHKVLYYGTLFADRFVALINDEHKAADTLKDYPAPVVYAEQPTDNNRVLFAHYKAPQAMMVMLSKQGEYDPAKLPIITMYNEYFGSGMNAIVFQEMREARALAYSAGARYTTAARPDRSNYMQANIGTQTDKLGDAITAFRDILDNMPQSETAFGIAKESIISGLRTERITKSGVLWEYLRLQRLGVDYDLRRSVYEQAPTLTLADVVKFQQDNVKNKTYTFCILGDEKAVNIKMLEQIGEVKKLSQKELFK